MKATRPEKSCPAFAWRREGADKKSFPPLLVIGAPLA